MSTTSEMFATKMMSPFVFTAELQDFILFLGLSALIMLLIYKVYYLFFYQVS